MEEAQLQEALALARRLALANALDHGGTAATKAVLAKLLGAAPELRPAAKELGPRIAAIVDEVNALPKDALETALAQLGGAPQGEGPPRTARRATTSVGAPAGGPTLPPLEGDTSAVVMRLAPGPSGPLHLGHSRMAILNDAYCKATKGTLLLRLEDTDPDRVMLEAFEWIAQDLQWLGVTIHTTVVQSDRFDLYYAHARRLLEVGAAYVSTAPEEVWRDAKLHNRPLPERHEAPHAQLERFDKMLGGAYHDGEAVLVIKTDLADPNPALRDWAAMRISTSPHPRTKDRYLVYPLMNLAVALDDHLLGLTHVLRGKDHLNNTYRQRWVFDALGWSVPHYIHYGRVRIDGPELSTSTMAAGIADGTYSGWDDVRLGTLRAMEARGIEPAALRRYWVEAGVNEVDVVLSWPTLYAFNKELIDDRSDRFCFTPDPRTVRIEGVEGPLERSSPLHPSHPERGERRSTLHPHGGVVEVLIAGADWDPLPNGALVRLKDMCNLTKVDGTTATFAGVPMPTGGRRPQILQWVEPIGALPLQVRRPEGPVDAGMVEAAAGAAAGGVVQLERYGFVRLQPTSAERPTQLHGAFAHR